MKMAIAKLKSESVYSQGRHHNTDHLNKELDEDYEKRTWREKLHYDENDEVFIPPMAFSNSIKEAAKYLSLPIKGKGKSTYTKNFLSGVIVQNPLMLGVKKNEVDCEWVFGDSRGERGGSGKRVSKCFPLIHKWQGEVVYYILDDVITEDVFLKVLKTSGLLIGVGKFRPKNGGYYGRFKVEDLKWQNQ